MHVHVHVHGDALEGAVDEPLTRPRRVLDALRRRSVPVDAVPCPSTPFRARRRPSVPVESLPARSAVDACRSACARGRLLTERRAHAAQLTGMQDRLSDAESLKTAAELRLASADAARAAGIAEALKKQAERYVAPPLPLPPPPPRRG